MQQTKNAPFIAIEGLEGASKTTSLRTVKEALRRHYTVRDVREPGGTPFAEDIRTIIKQIYEETIGGTTELLMMTAARVQLFDNVIMAALARGEAVLSDRSWLTTLAYQIFGRGLPLSAFIALYEMCLAKYRPYDLMIYLDVEPEIGMKRAAKRGELDRFETSQMDFFHRARQGYLSSMPCFSRFVIIDANETEAEVQQSVSVAINEFLSTYQGGATPHPDFSLLSSGLIL